MSSSLQTRLLVAVSVLALAAVAAVGIAARRGTRQEFLRFQQLEHGGLSGDLSATAARVAALLTGRCCTPESLRAAAALLSPRQALVVTEQGTGAALATAGPGVSDLEDLRVTGAAGRLTLAARRRQGRGVEGISLRLLDDSPVPIALADGRPARLHLIAFPRPEQEQPAASFLGSVDRRLLAATTLVGALSLLATWVLARRIVGPLGELRDAARDLARGNLSRRVATRGKDELAQLGDSFNAMATELERQQALRRDLVHDVAHELRTPLTSLRCRLETMLDGLAGDPRQALRGANEEVLHLSRLVDDLQELALAEARELRLAVADVAVAPVVVSAAGAAGLEGDARLRLELDEGLTVRADAVRMRQVVLNLLTNADRHTPADGTIVVRATRRGPEVCLEVGNTGSALDAEQLARAFDRFYRTDPSRQRATGGSGLGLAIVKNLVEAQNGRVWAESDEAGVRFGFALPASRIIAP